MQCVYPIQMYRCFLVLLHSDTRHLGIRTYEFVYMVELKRNLECSDMYYPPSQYPVRTISLPLEHINLHCGLP